MKTLRRLLFVLLAFSTLVAFVGCSEAEDTKQSPQLNPQLVAALGNEWATANKVTIEKLVEDLESANSAYRNGGELKDYFLTVSNVIDNNEEFRSNLYTGLEHAMESNIDYATLFCDSFMWSPTNSGIIYDARELFGEPLSAEDVTEIENELISKSNKISQLFYCKDIAS